jgi:hypothetical protein
MKAARWGALSALAQALDGGADALAGDSEALGVAALNGHVDCVRLLIPASDAKARQSYALRWAAHEGRRDCVELLIPASDPLARDSYALRMAAQHGHAECVKLLIEVSAPKARDSLALRWAGGGAWACAVREAVAAGERSFGAGRGRIERGGHRQSQGPRGGGAADRGVRRSGGLVGLRSKSQNEAKSQVGPVRAKGWSKNSEKSDE